MLIWAARRLALAGPVHRALHNAGSSTSSARATTSGSQTFRPPDPQSKADASTGVDRCADPRDEARRYRLASKRGQAIGRIHVPRLGLNMVVVNGTDHDSLTKGPGLDRRTYMPGEGQLVYIAGHRTTYLAPFAHIERMKAGDPITLEVPYGTFRLPRHHAHGSSRQRPRRCSSSHGREIVELQACHPRFFASHRYIAYARLVPVEPRGGAPSARSARRAAAARRVSSQAHVAPGVPGASSPSPRGRNTTALAAAALDDHVRFLAPGGSSLTAPSSRARVRARTRSSRADSGGRGPASLPARTWAAGRR